MRLRPGDPNSPAAEVTLESIELPSDSLAADVIDVILKKAQTKALQFKLLKKIVEAGAGKRAAAIYTEAFDDAPIAVQIVLIPVAPKKMILVKGRAAAAQWKNYAKLFQGIAYSIASLNVETAEDVEIVFTNSHHSPEISPDQTAPEINYTAEASHTPSGVSAARAFDGIESVAASCATKWQSCPDQKKMLAIIGDEKFAAVLWAALGTNYKAWLCSSVPALGKVTPLQCLRSSEYKPRLIALLSQLNARLDNLAELSELAPPTKAPSGPPALSLCSPDDSIVGSDANPLATIEKLLLTPDERRDAKWSSEFLPRLSVVQFYAPENPISAAPNGFTFYWLYTYAPTDFGNGRRVRIEEVISQITEEGLGIAIAGPKSQAWFASFGHACYFRVNKTFRVMQRPLPPPPPRGSENGIYVEAPNENLLPPYARRKLKAYLSEVCAVRSPMAFVEFDPQTQVFTLICNIPDGRWTSQADVEGALMVVSWHTPPNVGVAAIPGSSFPNYHLVL